MPMDIMPYPSKAYHSKFNHTNTKQEKQNIDD